MFLIGICDDSKELQNELSLCLNNTLIDDTEYNISIFSNGEELFDWIDSHKKTINLLFLDIEMPGKNGVEIKNLLEKEEKVQRIIFVTSHFENMQEAFGAKVVGFLFKPINFAEVSMKIATAYSDYKDNHLIEISKDVFVRKNEISYIKAGGNYCDYYFTNGKEFKAVRNTLSYCKDMFGDSFIQIHKSYIINAFDIKKRGRNKIELSNGVELPIGRSFIESFRSEYRNLAMNNIRTKI